MTWSMTLPRTASIGIATALTLGGWVASRGTPGPDGSSPTAAQTARVAQAVALPPDPGKLGPELLLDDFESLCHYGFAEFTRLVSPDMISEYETSLGRTVIVGTSRPNFLLGTSGADLILGFGGADAIAALGGDDRICGGPGDDHILGGDGQDLIRGGSGVDDVR